MKKITKNALFSLFAGVFVAVAVAFSPLAASTFAQDCSEGIDGGATAGINCAQGADQPSSLFGGDDSVFTTIVNVLLFIIGAISVIMLIIGGIRYTVSGGDSGSVTAAKNTILYAVIGLLVAFFAYAIINWVLGAVAP